MDNSRKHVVPGEMADQNFICFAGSRSVPLASRFMNIII